MQHWLLGAGLLFMWAGIDLNLPTWNCTHGHWGWGRLTSGTSGTWAGLSQQQSKMEKTNFAFRFVPLWVYIPQHGRTDWFNVQGSAMEDAAGRKNVINYLGETFSLTSEVHLLNSYI